MNKYKKRRGRRIVELAQTGETWVYIGELFRVRDSEAHRLYIHEITKTTKLCIVCKTQTLNTNTRYKKCKSCSQKPKRRERKIKLSGRDYTREVVRIRDKYTCQDCQRIWNSGERRFDVHHLNGLCGKKSRGYDSVIDISGLITLCHKCHYNRPEHTLKKKHSL